VGIGTGRTQTKLSFLMIRAQDERTSPKRLVRGYESAFVVTSGAPDRKAGAEAWWSHADQKHRNSRGNREVHGCGHDAPGEELQIQTGMSGLIERVERR
jgi:hypothetical protein